MTTLVHQVVPHSRPALATVLAAHVAAALLLVQIMEARRYIEPAPLSVTLLPEIREPAPLPHSDSVAEPAPPNELAPPHQPAPPHQLAPTWLQPPVPLPKMPVRHAFVEPAPSRQIESLPQPPAPAPAPEPPARTITEFALPPVPPDAPPAAPTIVQPQAIPVVDAPVPPPAVMARPVTPAPPVTAPAEQDDIVMDSRVLTAVYLSNPKPPYPNLSRRLGEQGTVMLRVLVSVAGESARIELKSSSGFPRLDRAALNAVRSWRFSPATRGDRAVEAWVLVPIRFSLKG